MLKSSIVVELPSAEVRRQLGMVESIQSFFGAKLDERSGYKATTLPAEALLSGLYQAFSRAGVTDAISLIVDKRAVFMDTQGASDDLGALLAAAARKRVFGRPFQQMHMALAHTDGRMRTIIDVAISKVVLVGYAEMQVQFSSRPVAVEVQPGEMAQQYAYRVRAFADDQNEIARQRQALEELGGRIAAELRTTLPGSRVVLGTTSVDLVRPDARRIGRFRRLGWGAQSSPPRYRPVPTRSQSGAFHDPFFYYYYDPYYDLWSYFLIDAMLHHGAWQHPFVHVTDPHGNELFTGTDAAHHSAESWSGTGTVECTPDGNICVDHSIPDDGGPTGALGDVDFSSAGTSGEGGAWSELGDSSGGSSAASCASSPTGASCGSTSSCGSSCSSGSSGSSCSSASSCSSGSTGSSCSSSST